MNMPQTNALTKRKYVAYVTYLVILSLVYPVLKTLSDAYSIQSTGKIAGSDEDWIHSILLKKEAKSLAISNSKRRVLIVSGSNGLFGMSAKLIESSVKIPTVNLSTHAGLGGEYILTKVKPLLNENDVVILPLEYSFYSSQGIQNDFDNSVVLRKYLVSYDKSGLKKISFLSLTKFILSNSFEFPIKEYMANTFRVLGIESLSKRFQAERIKISGNCYTSKTLNDYGDETCNENKQFTPLHPAIFQTAMAPSNSDIDPGRYIEDFIIFCKSKSITIIPLYPISTSTDDYSQLKYRQYASKIKDFWRSRGVKFKDSLDEAILPPQLMYNSLYHPIDAGRIKRTKYVIEILKSKI
jgi:hypothetical protein